MAKITIHDDKNKGSTSLINQSVTNDIEVIIPDQEGMLITDSNISRSVVSNNITSGFILKPKGLITPIENPSAFDGELFVQDYETTPNFNGKHTATQWLVSLDENFESIAIDYKEERKDKLLTYRPHITSRNTRLFIKYRFISDDIASVYSDVISYMTPSGAIGIPVISHTDKDYTSILKTEPMSIIGDLENTYLKETHWVVRKKDTKEIVFEKKTIDKKELTQIEIPEKILEPIYEYDVEVIHYSNRYGIYSLPGTYSFRPSFFGIKKPKIMLDDTKTFLFFMANELYLDHYKEAVWEIYGVVANQKKLLAKISDEFQTDQYKLPNNNKTFITLTLDKYLSREDIIDSIYDNFLITAKIVGFQYDSPKDEFILNKADVLNNIRNITLNNSLNEYSLPKLTFKIQANNFILERVGDSNVKNDIDLIIKSDYTKVIANFKRTGGKTSKKSFDITKYCKLSSIENKDGINNDITLDFNITPEALKGTDNLCYPYDTTPETLYRMENIIKDLTLIYFVNGRSGTRKKELVLEIKNGSIPVKLFDKELLSSKGKMVITNLKNDDITIAYERGVIENQKWNKTKSIEFKIFDKNTGALIETINKVIPESEALKRNYTLNINEVLKTNKLIVENEYILKAVLTSEWLQFETINAEFTYPKKELISPELSVTGAGRHQTVNILNNPMLNLPGDPWSYTKYFLYDDTGKIIHQEQLKGKVNSYVIPWNKLKINSDFIIGCTVISNDVESEEGRCKFSIGDVKINYSQLEFLSNGIINYNEPVGMIHGYNVIGANDQGSVFKYIDIEFYLNNTLITKGKINQDKIDSRFVIGGKKLKMELQPNTTYKVRCRVGCDWYEPSDWKEYNIKTSDTIMESQDNMVDLGSGNWIDGGVFGSVDRINIAPTSPEFNDLISSREYCGEWGDESQFRKTVLEKYNVTPELKAKYNGITDKQKPGSVYFNNDHRELYRGYDLNSIGYKETGQSAHWSYKTGDRVSYKDKLYEALKDQNWKQFEPDKYPDAWKLIEKDLRLPSEVEVLDNMGINWNIDNRSTTNMSKDGNNDIRPSEKGVISDVNRQSGWTKMLSPTDKRIIYVSTQPLLTGIAYNDILSRHKEYGLFNKFTLRFGTQLYFVRFATELELKYLLEYETLAKKNTPTIKDDQSYSCNFNTASFITRENFDNFKENVEAFGNTTELTNNSGIKLGTINYRKKIGALRVVIVPLKEEEAPYNFLSRNLPSPTMRVPFDNNFVYDKFTDTGFLGISKPMMSFEELMNAVGLTGTAQRVTNFDNYSKEPYTYWIGRYYHGMVTLEPLGPIANNLSFLDLLNNKLVYGYGVNNKVLTVNGVKFTLELPTYLRRNNLVFKSKAGLDWYSAKFVQRQLSIVGKSFVSEYFRNLTVKQNPKLNSDEIAGVSWWFNESEKAKTLGPNYCMQYYTSLGKFYKSDVELTFKGMTNFDIRYKFKTGVYLDGKYCHKYHSKEMVIVDNKETNSSVDLNGGLLVLIQDTANEADSKIYVGWKPLLVANIDLTNKELKWDDIKSKDEPEVIVEVKNNNSITSNLKNYLISNMYTRSYRKEIVDLGSKLGKMLNLQYPIFIKTRYPHYSDYRLNELSQVSLVMMKGFIPQVKHPIFYVFTSNAQTYYKELLKYGLDPKKYIDQVLWIDDLGILTETRKDVFKGKWFEKTTYTNVEDVLISNYIKNMFIFNGQLKTMPVYNFLHTRKADQPSTINMNPYKATTYICNNTETTSIYKYVNGYYKYSNFFETPDDYNYLNRFVLLSELEEFFVSIKESLYVDNWESVLPNLNKNMNDVFNYLYNQEKVNKVINGLFIVNDLNLSLNSAKFDCPTLTPMKFKHPMDYTLKIGSVPLVVFLKKELMKFGMCYFKNNNFYNRFFYQDENEYKMPKDVEYNTLAAERIKDPNNYVNNVSYYIPKPAVNNNAMYGNGMTTFVHPTINWFKGISNYTGTLLDGNSITTNDLTWDIANTNEKITTWFLYCNKILSEIMMDRPNTFFLSVTSSNYKSVKNNGFGGNRYNKFNIFYFKNYKDLISAYYLIRKNANDFLDFLTYNNSDKTVLTGTLEEKEEALTNMLYGHLISVSVIARTTEDKVDFANAMIRSSDYDNINEIDRRAYFYDYMDDNYYLVEDDRNLDSTRQFNLRFIDNYLSWLGNGLNFHCIFRDNLESVIFRNNPNNNNDIKLIHNMGKKYVRTKYADYGNKQAGRDVRKQTMAETLLNDVSPTKTSTHGVIDFIDEFTNDVEIDIYNYGSDARTIHTNINYPYKRPIMFNIDNTTINNINFTIDGNNSRYTTNDTRLLEPNSTLPMKNNLLPDNITSFAGKCLTNRVTAYTYVTNPDVSDMDFVNDVDVNKYNKNYNLTISQNRCVTKTGEKGIHEDLIPIIKVENLISTKIQSNVCQGSCYNPFFKYYSGMFDGYGSNTTDKNNKVYIGFVPMTLADEVLWYIDEIITYRDELNSLMSNDVINENVKTWAKNNWTKYLVLDLFVNYKTELFKLNRNKFKDYIDSIIWYDAMGSIVIKYYKPHFIDVALRAPTSTNKDAMSHTLVDKNTFKANYLKHPYTDFKSYPNGTIGKQLGGWIYTKDECLISTALADILNQDATNPNIIVNDIILNNDISIVDKYLATGIIPLTNKFYNQGFTGDNMYISMLRRFGKFKSADITIAGKSCRLYFINIKYFNDIVYYLNLAQRNMYDSNKSCIRTRYLNYIIWINEDRYNNKLPGITEYLNHAKMKVNKTKNLFLPNNTKLLEYPGKDRTIDLDKKSGCFTTKNLVNNTSSERAVVKKLINPDIEEASISVFGKNTSSYVFSTSKTEDRALASSPYTLNFGRTDLNKLYIPVSQFNNHRLSIRELVKKYPANINTAIENAYYYDDIGVMDGLGELQAMPGTRPIYDKVTNSYLPLDQYIFIRMNYTYLPDLVSTAKGIAFKETVKNLFSNSDDKQDYNWFNNKGDGLAKAFNHFRELYKTNVGAYYIKRLNIEAPGGSRRLLLWNVGGFDNFFNVINWNYVKCIEHIPELEYLYRFKKTAVLVNGSMYTMGMLRNTELNGYYDFLLREIIKEGVTSPYLQAKRISDIMNKVLIWIDEPDGTDNVLESGKTNLNINETKFTISGTGVMQYVTLDPETVTQAINNKWLSTVMKVYNSAGAVVSTITHNNTNNNSKFQIPADKIQVNVTQKVEMQVITKLSTFTVGSGTFGNKISFAMRSATWSSPGKNWLNSEDLHATMSGITLTDTSKNNANLTDNYTKVKQVYYEVWNGNTKQYSETINVANLPLNNVSFKINPLAKITYDQTLTVKIKLNTVGYGWSGLVNSTLKDCLDNATKAKIDASYNASGIKYYMSGVKDSISYLTFIKKLFTVGDPTTNIFNFIKNLLESVDGGAFCSYVKEYTPFTNKLRRHFIMIPDSKTQRGFERYFRASGRKYVSKLWLIEQYECYTSTFSSRHSNHLYIANLKVPSNTTYNNMYKQLITNEFISPKYYNVNEVKTPTILLQDTPIKNLIKKVIGTSYNMWEKLDFLGTLNYLIGYTEFKPSTTNTTFIYNASIIIDKNGRRNYDISAKYEEKTTPDVFENNYTLWVNILGAPYGDGYWNNVWNTTAESHTFNPDKYTLVPKKNTEKTYPVYNDHSFNYYGNGDRSNSGVWSDDRQTVRDKTWHGIRNERWEFKWVQTDIAYPKASTGKGKTITFDTTDRTKVMDGKTDFYLFD